MKGSIKVEIYPSSDQYTPLDIMARPFKFFRYVGISKRPLDITCLWVNPQFDYEGKRMGPFFQIMLLMGTSLFLTEVDIMFKLCRSLSRGD